MHSCVHCSIIHNIQDREATEMSFCRRTNKENVIQAMEYYSASQKKDIMRYSTTWLDLEDTMLT